MSECSIELSFLPVSPDWKKSLKSLKKIAGHKALPAFWWQQLASVDGEAWDTLKENSSGQTRPLIEDWEAQGDKLKVFLFGGDESFDVARCLVELMTNLGHKSVESIVCTDECDCITDDDGNVHQIGTRYFINADNEVEEADYPDIEYEYYD